MRREDGGEGGEEKREGVSEKRRGRGLETLATQAKKIFNIVNFAALFILALGTGLSYNC